MNNESEYQPDIDNCSWCWFTHREDNYPASSELLKVNLGTWMTGWLFMVLTVDVVVSHKIL